MSDNKTLPITMPAPRTLGERLDLANRLYRGFFHAASGTVRAR
jgi:hypothetical protein